MTDLKNLIEKVGEFVPDAKKGLPQDIFYFISRLTPLINADLLIKNDKNQALLVWREDQFYRGWHIAGGIIRFKEKISDRILAVAKNEFGAAVEFDPAPLAMHEKFATDRDIRGHFISLLYRCRLLSELNDTLKCVDPENPKTGQWMWHDKCPDNLIHQHEVYRKFIDP